MITSEDFAAEVNRIQPTQMIWYENKTKELRKAWNDGIRSAKIIESTLNEMISALLNAHRNWSVRQAVMHIIEDNNDLEGLSYTTLYRKLNPENRKMLRNYNVLPETIIVQPITEQTHNQSSPVKEQEIPNFDKIKGLDLPTKDENTELKTENAKLRERNDSLNTVSKQVQDINDSIDEENFRLKTENAALREKLENAPSMRSHDGKHTFRYDNMSAPELLQHITKVLIRTGDVFKIAYLERIE